MRRKLVEFLIPDKRKLVLTFLLPMFWFIIISIFHVVYNVLRPPEGTVILIPGINLGVVPLLSYIVITIFLYPSACSMVTLFDAYKDRRLTDIFRDKGLLLLIIIGIIMFNPITWMLLFILILILT